MGNLAKREPIAVTACDGDNGSVETDGERGNEGDYCC